MSARFRCDSSILQQLPRVVNKYNLVRQDGVTYVNIQRPSKWGNRNKLRQGVSRDSVIDAYEQDVRNNPALMAALPELFGTTLVCSCKPRACHGDVLVSLCAELLYDKEKNSD